MNTDTKAYKVTIFNKEYSLISDESEKHILEAAQMVDALMKNLHDGTKSNSDIQKLSAFAALQIASSLLHSKNLQNKSKKAVSDLITFIDRQLSEL